MKSAKELLTKQFHEHDRNPAKSWMSVFQAINSQIAKRAKSLKLTCKVAYSCDNVDKNRYRDISPYDQNRITLGADGNYINASPVPVEETNQNYILCQGPLDETCVDFWQMVWEQNVPTIVMLNKLIERGMLKCAPYFPSLDVKELEFKPYKIVCEAEEEEGDFTKRILSLRQEDCDEVKTITHIQYTEWPDFGVPKSTSNLLHLMRRYWELHGRDNSAPAVVHCSAGVGRSGTFVVVDTVIRLVESGTEVDMEKLIVRLREKRMGLIQTPQQLRFSWQTIVDYFQPGECETGSGDGPSTSEGAAGCISGRKRDSREETRDETLAKRQDRSSLLDPPRVLPPPPQSTVFRREVERREDSWRVRVVALYDGFINTLNTLLS
ncbi:hypothetical protein PFISCL1PPCAC_19579 [Pristionchus fissidentatus]|uniref:protein-tyrosine-phosphatase n=1 Tax=Pristionchus fissidentatus TaxID=1538716 RepID=A0AAV5W901_9BILA|nr:hypothetical protein PFISCL1PPCAC_19579 [Pristionchus fissidentatus]